MPYEKGEMSNSEFEEFIFKLKKSQELQKMIIDSAHQKIIKRNIYFLIDTYGLFKGAKDFWSEFSKRKVDWAINFIAVRALEMIRTGYELYASLHHENLIREYQIGKICHDLNNDIDAIKKELDGYDGILCCKFISTYAAAPDANGRIKKKIEQNIFEGLIESAHGKSFITSMVV